jgi:hypothetical protein
MRESIISRKVGSARARQEPKTNDRSAPVAYSFIHFDASAIIAPCCGQIASGGR